MRQVLAFYGKHLWLGLTKLFSLGGLLSGWWGTLVGFFLLVGLVPKTTDFFEFLKPYGWCIITTVYVLSFLGSIYKGYVDERREHREQVEELRKELSAQRARAGELEAKLNPPDAERMAAAKRLLRDARDEAFRRATEKEKLTKEEVQAFFGDANKLVFRVLVKGKYTQMFNDRIMYPSKSKLADPWELMKEMGTDLSFFVEEMEFCPEGFDSEADEQYLPFLRPDFVPVEGRSWREYPYEEEANPTLKLRLEQLIPDCKECRDREGSHDMDAERIARKIGRMCDAFPDEQCLETLRDDDKGSYQYPCARSTMAADKWLNRAHHQLEEALDKLEYPER